jgi:hypothetical protein
MFKHEIAYVDFNGQERKEAFYFHLSLPEVTRLEVEIGKPIGDHAQELADNQDMKLLLPFLEKVILSAYGKKTSDGKSFYKSKDIRDEFEYSQAYAEMFEQLLTNPDLARKFGEGVADNGKAKKNTVEPSVINN